VLVVVRNVLRRGTLRFCLGAYLPVLAHDASVHLAKADELVVQAQRVALLVQLAIRLRGGTGGRPKLVRLFYMAVLGLKNSIL
jgi:hypothetical protein